MIGASTFDKVQAQLSSIRAESTRIQRRMADRDDESSSDDDDHHRYPVERDDRHRGRFMADRDDRCRGIKII